MELVGYGLLAAIVAPLVISGLVKILMALATLR
jgi:Flp pilus assembly pilin Flp